MSQILNIDHRIISGGAVALSTGVALYSTYKWWSIQKQKHTQNVYESNKLLNEYLVFHYGESDEVLAYPFGPSESVDFPERCAKLCMKHFQKKPDVHTAVKELLSLKGDYKSLTGKDWIPGAAPVDAPAKDGGSAATSENSQETGRGNEDIAVHIQKIMNQDKCVRKLKEDKASKTDVEAAVKQLLILKGDYKSQTGKDWTPRVAILNQKIPDQADLVRQLKADKAPKADLPNRALDIGCAVGRSSFEMTRTFDEVIGIDYSQSFIEACNRLKRDGSMPYSVVTVGDLEEELVAEIDPSLDRSKTIFQQGDACNLSTNLGQFGCVLAANLICRLHTPKDFLNRLASLVATDGILVITSPYTFLREYTPRDKWIGGYVKSDGREVSGFEGLKQTLSPAFDLVAEEDMPFFIRETARKNQWTVAHATADLPNRALDIGCAVGRSSFEMTRTFDEVIGIDYSQSFIEACNRLKRDGSMPYSVVTVGDLEKKLVAEIDPSLDRSKTIFQQGDACNLSTNLGQFGCVLAANLICRLHTPKDFLNRLASLVATDGILVITSPYTFLREYTPRDKWIGGYVKSDGQEVSGFEGLKQTLSPAFDLVAEEDMPFFIRETARKNQWTVAHATVWQRKS